MADWEAEGLLDGLEGEAREARRRLLDRVEAAGTDPEQVREAVRQGMLPFLLAEREVTGPQTLSQREVAEQAGLELEVVRALRRSQGLPAPDPDVRIFGEGDLELARTMRGLLDAGVPLPRLLETGRLIGRGLAPVAELMRATALEQAFAAELPEDELAEAFRLRAAALLPFIAPSLVGAMRAQLRSMVAAEVARVAEDRGGLPGAQAVTVAFADLTGFTRLGEQLPASDLSAVAERLGAALAGTLEEGVRVVKELGDGAMLVSPEPAPLVRTALALVDADPELPPVRVGLASGDAVPRAGDWFGRPVNLASRVCSAARPGSVLATREVRDAVGEVAWSSAGGRHLRGVGGTVRLYRARPS
jgi:adenylate cyclase